MKFEWNEEKNELLKQTRGVGFEDVVYHVVECDGLLDDIDHPNQADYPNQRMLVVNIDDYAYIVPYVGNETGIFLKTIFPSRKATKAYLGGKS